ncbi:MAG: RHS repeat-associated core domain-containing protein [bacterium]|nr:RHS repeat-associated core domain-containing protein [bacterium]
MTSYAYDAGSRLRLASTPLAGGGSQERTWAYDQRGFLLSESHPEKGTDVVYDLHDPLGNAGQRVDGPNDVRFSFDRAGRLTAVEEALDEGTRPLKSYAFGTVSDPSNWANSKVVEAIGHNHLPITPGSTEDQRFIENFTYGGVGGRVSHRRVQWSRACDGGPPCNNGYLDDVAFEHSETYSEIGDRASVTYPECTGDISCAGQWPRTVMSTYAKGYLTGVTGWASIDYHRNHTVDEVVHANGVTDAYGEDPNKMSRPKSITATLGAQTLWASGDYRYDGAGNVLEMVPAVVGERSDKYLYDSVSRLVGTDFYVPSVPAEQIFYDGFESGDTSAWTATQTAGDFSGFWTFQGFAYDRFGNLLAVDTDGEVEVFPVDEATNRLSSPAVYDEAGNLLSMVDSTGATVSFEYDALNRLIHRQRDGETAAWVFAHTADDERIAKLELTSGELRWMLRDSGGLLLREFEYDEGGDIYPVRDEIYRGPSLLATVSQDESGVFGEAAHYSLDHLGTPRLITTDTGEVKSLHKYYPFGEEATLANQDRHPMKFTGHERDFFAPGESDDLDYMHARYCSPHLSRFMSVDPVLGNPAIPQSWNRFVYARNNPVRYVDPDGRAVQVADDDALGLILETLPAELRQHVVVDSEGLISAESLNSVTTDNKNFEALRELVGYSGVFEARTAAGFETSGGATETFEFSTAEQEIQRLAAQIGREQAEQLRGEMIGTTFLGKFNAASESLSGRPQVIVSDGTGKANGAPRIERVVTMAHELYGHALLYSRSQSYLHDSGGPVDALISGVQQRTQEVLP